jgi:hypothetical protein
MAAKNKQEMVTEDDDFEFGKTVVAEKETGGDPPAEVEDTPEPEKEKGDDFSDDIDDIEKEEEKKKEPEEKKEEEPAEDKAKEEKKAEDEVDFFADDEPVKEEVKPTFDVKDLAKEFEIEAEDVNDFKAKINEKIEKSKQEFKLDSLSPDAQAIVRHVNENGGTLDDFFTNPEIADLQGVIAMDAEDKAIYVTSLNYQSGKDKLSPEEAQEKAEEDIKALSTRQIKDIADKVDENARNMIKSSVDKIVGERAKIVEQQRQKEQVRVQQEIAKIEKYVTDQADFLGLPLTAKATANIVQDIRSGKFDEIANTDPVKAKFTAYMFNKYGDKLNDTIKSKLSEANRTGYNAAIDKSLETLHKTKEEAKGKNTARMTPSKGNAKNFEDWKGEFGDE